MTFKDFEVLALSLLNTQPLGTWMRFGHGYLGIQNGNTLLCIPGFSQPVPDMQDFIEKNLGEPDDSAWDGDAFTLMTSAQMDEAFSNPEFHFFGLPNKKPAASNARAS